MQGSFQRDPEYQLGLGPALSLQSLRAITRVWESRSRLDKCEFHSLGAAK